MTYFGVLLRFIGPPLVALIAITLYDRRRHALSYAFQTWPASTILWIHVLIALVYTTPWDNYLVANRIWWYDPSLVAGVTLGWVPIEEYTFFVVQTLMTGLWVLLWMRRLPVVKGSFEPRSRARWIATGLVGVVWLVWVVLFLAGWPRGRYMALLLGWFFPPILLQLAFGADILWHHRRLVALSVSVPTVYLFILDAAAIASGTWTINPQNTLGLDLGVLPLEEMVFFAITNILVSFGMILALARESHVRIGERIPWLADAR